MTDHTAAIAEAAREWRAAELACDEAREGSIYTPGSSSAEYDRYVIAIRHVGAKRRDLRAAVDAERAEREGKS